MRGSKRIFKTLQLTLSDPVQWLNSWTLTLRSCLTTSTGVLNAAAKGECAVVVR